ncbi:MAG: 4-hydroxy-3-methylbut-2-enyl diphosphate reductase [Puniceicoccaceae bacterium]
MRVIRAKSAGFCWGVERAIDIARNFAKNEKRKVITDGPLIHNSQMMEHLTSEGIREVGDYESNKELDVAKAKDEEAVLVVRAHGISPERRKYLKSLGLEFRDATCPDVGLIAGKIRAHARKGYHTLIFGDPKHPEVVGLLGYADDHGHVIQTEQDIAALDLDPATKVCMVSQSTMFTDEFERLAMKVREVFSEVLIFDTICGATKERQTDLRKLVQDGAEAIVVIGGHHSANTRKLAKLSELQEKPTFHIETAEEINPEIMAQFKVVGVTAGASTPDFIIDAVCDRLRKIESTGESVAEPLASARVD